MPSAPSSGGTEPGAECVLFFLEIAAICAQLGGFLSQTQYTVHRVDFC
ncbi:hypothetical protein A2U01_0084267 [Trifolium medium]|uniref:Uncharacterized protein n=1 Tax=Trifolium medium TaxID=97028 RepID=A0A392TS06_9FABA|nr:hypothetical protein [Trifolium medium]